MSDTDDRVRSTFESTIDHAIADLGVPALSRLQLDQLWRHYSLLSHWNTKVNLTRVVAPAEAARFHYAESLFGGCFVGDGRTLLDIGSGAGFPAVPLAVMLPGVQVTALEANQKKSLFLKEAKDALGLNNLSIATNRLKAVDLTGYDLLTSRALDRSAELLPQTIEQLVKGQRFMLYAGKELVGMLASLTGSLCTVDIHCVKHSDERVVAMFARS